MPDPFVQGLRLTVFGDNQRWAEPRPILPLIFGREADTNEQNVPLQLSVSRAQGQPHGWQLTVQSIPGRLDILQDAALAPVLVGSVSKRMHASAEVISLFINRVSAQAKDLIDDVATRIALGTTLRWKVSSPSDAIDYLKQWHPHLDLRPEDIDVIFQRNRPTSIRIASEELRINRIEQWSMPTFSVFATLPEREVSRQYCVQLTTDVNTAQGREKTLPKEAVQVILDHLRSLTCAICERSGQ